MKKIITCFPDEGKIFTDGNETFSVISFNEEDTELTLKDVQEIDKTEVNTTTNTEGE